MFCKTLVSRALLCAVAWLPGAALAADGQTLISQSRALKGNVTAGDAPGFPVTISRSGSFRLASNLTVPANTDGIVLAANDVTLDLNGFTIAGGGSGKGISEVQSLVGPAVRNGTVRSFAKGIDLVTSVRCEIERIRAVDNVDFGILVGQNSIVTGNLASGNGGTGILASSQSILSGNNASQNESGFQVGRFSLVSENTASDNDNVGIIVACPSNLVGNTALSNPSDIIEIDALGTCTFANNNPAAP